MKLQQHAVHPFRPAAPSARRASARRAVTALALAAALAVAATPASGAANPYERGPDPTAASVSAARGSFAISQSRIPSSVAGFGGGTIYYPQTTSAGTFGAVAISPGYYGTWSTLAWLGPRLASQGFVVVGINTDSILDYPAARGDQLLAALDWAVTSSPAARRIDRSRLAVAGHSMGGGGSLEAAADRPSLQAALLLAPWNERKDWSGLRVPTLVLGAENDSTAPVGEHAERFYTSIPAASEKAYLELDRATHLFPLSASALQGRYVVSWLKRFVDDDTRYDQFLCPGPAGGSAGVQEYRNTCPLG